MAVGFKEPFFLSMLVAAMFLLPTRRAFVDSFLIPLGIAAAIGIAANYYGHHFIFGVPAYVGFFFLCIRGLERRSR